MVFIFNLVNIFESHINV